jgi:hypothetical protein
MELFQHVSTFVYRSRNFVIIRRRLILSTDFFDGYYSNVQPEDTGMFPDCIYNRFNYVSN